MAKSNTGKPQPATNYELAFYEAQSFLTAPEAISKKAQSILISGLQTEDPNMIDKSVGLKYAEYINHSYAFELLLKCIMIIENEHFYAGHNLLNLFEKLNPSSQLDIKDRFDQYKMRRRHRTYFGIFEDVDILMVLEEAGTAFIEFRYLFENNRKNTPSYDLKTATECLEYYIAKIQPKLKKL